MNITHEGTDIIGYYCMCIYFVLNKYYYIIILYGGSHASDILHVLMGVSVAKLIIYNIVLIFICNNKRSSSSSVELCWQHSSRKPRHGAERLSTPNEFQNTHLETCNIGILILPYSRVALKVDLK